MRKALWGALYIPADNRRKLLTGAFEIFYLPPTEVDICYMIRILVEFFLPALNWKGDFVSFLWV